MIRLAGTLLPRYAITRANCKRGWAGLTRRFNRQNPTSDDPLTCWLDWVGEEERKRLGWFAFMMDLENAALYRHFLMVSLSLFLVLWSSIFFPLSLPVLESSEQSGHLPTESLSTSRYP